MRRAIHIVVSLLAMIMLVHPLDCFASGMRNRKAMECCLKGKCAPTANSDDCCKNTVPGGNHFLLSKSAGHLAPVLTIPLALASPAIPALSAEAPDDSVTHPPPLASLTARNLPLLI